MTPRHDHPFLTVTVAEIYERQGKLDQAKDILQQILAADPTHARAPEQLERVQAQIHALALVAETTPASHGAPHETSQAADWITLRTDAGMLQCEWRVTPDGRRRAEYVLEGPGALTLRQAHFASDRDSAVIDVPLDRDQGSLSLSFPAGASVVSAALGLQNGDGRFVAIAHTDHISLEPWTQGLPSPAPW